MSTSWAQLILVWYGVTSWKEARQLSSCDDVWLLSYTLAWRPACIWAEAWLQEAALQLSTVTFVHTGVPITLRLKYDFQWVVLWCVTVSRTFNGKLFLLLLMSFSFQRELCMQSTSIIIHVEAFVQHLGAFLFSLNPARRAEWTESCFQRTWPSRSYFPQLHDAMGS